MNFSYLKDYQGCNVFRLGVLSSRVGTLVLVLFASEPCVNRVGKPMTEVVPLQQLKSDFSY